MYFLRQVLLRFMKDGKKPDPYATQPITHWLQSARQGNAAVLDELFGVVYPVLHRMASAKPGVHHDGILSPTEVVSELFLKIKDGSNIDIEDRHHFFATCSRAMRFIVADFARAALSLKRGGEVDHCTFTTALASRPDKAQELLDLHQALDDLDQLNGNLRELVELKFFGGLTYTEIGQIQTRSERSIKRDWVKARAFLLARSGKGFENAYEA